MASAVTLVTAQGADGAPPDWATLARLGQTLVVYMGARQVAEIAMQLVRHGRPAGTAVAVITHGTTPDQEIVTGTLADIGQRYPGRQHLAPALMIIGDTVALAAELSMPPADAARRAAATACQPPTDHRSQTIHQNRIPRRQS